jgi:uncharacterized membrane protein
MTQPAPPAPQKKFALRVNIWLLGFTRHWLRYVLLFFGLYVSFSFLTPVLMHFGVTGPARVLYTLYSPFCHQFAFRSLFLFGEQTTYPRAITGTSQNPFEVYAAKDADFLAHYDYWYRANYGGAAPQTPTEQSLANEWSVPFQFASRDFVGSEQMGYKMTLCMRDIAIYTFIFVGGLIYSRPYIRRRLRPAPLWLYALLGLTPIAIDGLSQMLGYPPFNLWYPRETLPIFRLLTGGLFGLMSAWLAFPYLELSMHETREQLEAKLARAGIQF